MKYIKIVKGVFLSRPNRFVANVIIDDEINTVHVKNTGRCKELLVPGCVVYLEDFEGRMGNRKLRYSLVCVEKKTKDGKSLLINMDSQAPNMVAKEALLSGKVGIDSLGKISLIRPETVYSESRFDFYLEGEKGKGFLEVKGCTLEKDGICSFPDAPTKRGTKHILELRKAKKEGYYAGILFVVQLRAFEYMMPNYENDPEFAKALECARDEGVEVLVYSCDVGIDSISIRDKSLIKYRGYDGN